MKGKSESVSMKKGKGGSPKKVAPKASNVGQAGGKSMKAPKAKKPKMGGYY